MVVGNEIVAFFRTTCSFYRVCLCVVRQRLKVFFDRNASYLFTHTHVYIYRKKTTDRIDFSTTIDRTRRSSPPQPYESLGIIFNYGRFSSSLTNTSPSLRVPRRRRSCSDTNVRGAHIRRPVANNTFTRRRINRIVVG